MQQILNNAKTIGFGGFAVFFKDVKLVGRRTSKKMETILFKKDKSYAFYAKTILKRNVT